jgi:hypothetical protein
MVVSKPHSAGSPPSSSGHPFTSVPSSGSFYGPGEGTSAVPITEAVPVNDTIATDATSTAAHTIARIAVVGISAKAAGQSLVAMRSHDIAGY